MENKIREKIEIAVSSKLEKIIKSLNLKKEKQIVALRSALYAIYEFNENIYVQAVNETIVSGYVSYDKLTYLNSPALLDFLISKNKGFSKRCKTIKVGYNFSSFTVFKSLYNNIYSSEVVRNYLKILFKKSQSQISKLMKKLSDIVKIEKILSNGVAGPLWGLSPSQLYSLDQKFISNLLRLMDKYFFTKHVADLLGKAKNSQNKFEETLIKTLEEIPGRKAKFYSPSNFQGITTGNNIPDVLPHVLSYRNKQSLNILFKKQFIEKQLTQFEKYAFDKEQKTVDVKSYEPIDKKGPFVMAIDTSGSMFGEPEEIAKAMALAIVNVVSKENRKCMIISFSTSTVIFDASDIKNNWKYFYEFLSESFWGGTDISEVIEESTKIISTSEYVNADLLFISDMQIGEINKDIFQKIDALKKKGTKFRSLTIGNHYSLDNISFLDSNWVYDGTQESIDKIIFDLNTINKQI